MSISLRLALGASLSAGAATAARADVTLHRLFSDNAVLQRDLPLPVWGKALPGEKITVTLDRSTANAVADTAGLWIVRLDPHAAGGPFDLVARGAEGDTVRAVNVLIGDVWLCSGQSNMAFDMEDDIAVAAEDIDKATDSSIRQFFVSHGDDTTPRRDLRDGSWAVCSPASVLNFSAVGYFLARDLRRSIGVPIGIINSAVGATKVEKWISTRALSGLPEMKAVIDRSEQAREDHLKALQDFRTRQTEFLKSAALRRAEGKPVPKAPYPPHDYPPTMPSGHYNAMIASLIPFALRGVAWYQGESNADDPGLYRSLFPLLITSWREDWGSRDLPFLYVQLANYQPSDSTKGRWAELRDVQAEALSLPGTGMAVAIDVGESHDIHPKNKKAVGQRLALLAEALVYGLPVEHSGPTFRTVSLDGRKARISFDHQSNGGLKVRGPTLEGFTVAGPDTVFHPARAILSGSDVLIWSDDVADLREVRYGWADDPVCNLYNSAGLPARPFRARVP